MEYADDQDDHVVQGVARNGWTMKWFKLKTLGAGSYGVVHQVKPLNTHYDVYAVKSCRYRFSYSLQKESQILKEFIGCPAVVQCYGDMLSVEHGMRIYNLFLEFAAAGTLLDLINKKYRGKIPESHARSYARMLAIGVHAIHAKGYVHCDLKPANILVYPTQYHYGVVGCLKVADFGLARRRGEVLHVPAAADKSELSSNLELKFPGTAVYMPPESINAARIDASIDIWSLGCLVLQMITGKLPWEYQNMNDLAYKLVHLKTPEIPQGISREGADFLMRCFATNPAERWTAGMLLCHPFLDPFQPNSPHYADDQANFILLSNRRNAAALHV